MSHRQRTRELRFEIGFEAEALMAALLAAVEGLRLPQRKRATSMSSKSEPAMIDVTPVPPSRPKTRRWSIKTKFLLWLLVLSLLPLILAGLISLPWVVIVREQVRSDLIGVARHHLVRFAEDQATIVSAKLDKVVDETRTAALLVQALLPTPLPLAARDPIPSRKNRTIRLALLHLFLLPWRLASPSCRQTRVGPFRQFGKGVCLC